MRYYSVVVDWQSDKLTWRTTRMRVVANNEDHACYLAIDKVKSKKNYLKHIQVSTLCENL